MIEIEEVLGGPEYAPYTVMLIVLSALVCAAFLALGHSPLQTLGATEGATAAIVTAVVCFSGILAACRFVNRCDWRYRALGWSIIAIYLVATNH